jgi:hypothetical protein
MISLRIYLLVGAQVPEEGDVLLSGHFLRVALVTDFSRLTAFCIFSKFFKTTLETLHVFDIFNCIFFNLQLVKFASIKVWALLLTACQVILRTVSFTKYSFCQLFMLICSKVHLLVFRIDLDYCI